MNGTFSLLRPLNVLNCLRTMWKRSSTDCVLLGAASASDDEPPPSDDEGCPTNRDQPHLRFEITSDDGFSVEADTIEGKASVTF